MYEEMTNEWRINDEWMMNKDYDLTKMILILRQSPYLIQTETQMNGFLQFTNKILPKQFKKYLEHY